MIGFDFKISKEKVETLLANTLRDAIPDSIEISSLDIHLKLAGNPHLNITGKQILFGAPFTITFKKNAGLFTVSGAGKIEVNILSNFDINQDFLFTTDTHITGYKWLEKAVVDFGNMDITVEKLVNLSLEHYKDVIESSIDSALKSSINIQKKVAEVVTNFKLILSSFNFFGLSFFVEPSEIIVEPITTKDDHFYITGAIGAELGCAEVNPFDASSIKLKWAEKLLHDNVAHFHVNITEKIISDLLCTYVNKQQYGGENLVSHTCLVDFKKEGVDIKMSISKPIAGDLIIKGKPNYSAVSSKLSVDNLDINIKPESFIYKLTAPLMSKYMESELTSKLPLDVDDLISSQTKKYKSTKFQREDLLLIVSFDKIDLSDLHTTETSLNGVFKINEIVLHGII
ncbi:MAG: hypothetical protein RLZZ546_2266 [Bacteroidota bacterium]|jgi:hypothetical protein